MRKLFFVGNKRSGTELLRGLLNSHPDIFIAHEADLAWILYQCMNTSSWDFRCHELDSPPGMWKTLWMCHYDILTAQDLKTHSEIEKAYYVMIDRLSGKPHGRFAWTGDKKPVQNAYPPVRDFIVHHFPDAWFIHITRHPAACVGSMIALAGRSPLIVPQFWFEDRDSLFDRWAQHERWAMEAEKMLPTIQIKYEDLCTKPQEEMNRVFAVLGVRGHTVSGVQTGKNAKYELTIPNIKQVIEVADRLGYENES